ncbi:MAG: PriCT-2 domain-containing protein [Methyloprofundus sp.]|nr:PriCT-2 domain-containing protein [Methyloprofundus sp.]
MMNKIYKVAVGSDKNMGEVANKEVSWQKLTEVFTNHKQSDNKGGQFFVGGHFREGIRKEENLTCRSVLTIDIDNTGLTIDQVEAALVLGIDYAFIAHTTFSHVPDNARVRVLIPLSAEVPPGQYEQISRDFANNLDGLNIDSCTFKANQFMWLPQHPAGAEHWSMVQDGEPYEVPLHVSLVKEEEPQDLELMAEHEPLDLTLEEIKGYLDAYSPEGLDYDDWMRTGAALNHQFQGSQQGYELWLEWSKRSSKHDPRQMPMKYKSFGRKSKEKLVKFSSVIFAINNAGVTLANVRSASGKVFDGEIDDSDNEQIGSVFDQLLAEASKVATMEEYDAYKKKVKCYNEILLPSDYRAMIAAELANGIGKDMRITRSDIKRALVPSRTERKVEKKCDKLPSYLADWVYVEMTCEFVNTRLGYAIKREAFNAKFDRMPEVVMSEKSAAAFALNDCHLTTVVDKVFWPGAELYFETDGKLMVNDYRHSGVPPADVITADGQKAIQMVLDHVAFTIEDAREQRILLDWLAYVVQHPGKRVNWALLLQGAQGVGKSYFVELLQHVMGDLVRNLDPTAIAGRFTGWAHGSLVTAVEEIRINGTNRYEVLDRMKPFITNRTVQIEEKGRDHRTVPNFTSYFLLTNHRDAIPLSAGDRRYCVLFSRVQSEEQLYKEKGGAKGAAAYFDELFSATLEHAPAIARWLLDYKISADFDPKGRAPETKAREFMQQVSVSPERSVVEDCIAGNECAVINSEVVDITWLNGLAGADGTELPKTRALSAVLLEMGYSPIDGRRVKIKKTNAYHYVWTKGDSGMAKAAVTAFHDGDNEPPF